MYLLYKIKTKSDNQSFKSNIHNTYIEIYPEKSEFIIIYIYVINAFQDIYFL